MTKGWSIQPNPRFYLNMVKITFTVSSIGKSRGFELSLRESKTPIYVSTELKFDKEMLNKHSLHHVVYVCIIKYILILNAMFAFFLCTLSVPSNQEKGEKADSH